MTAILFAFASAAFLGAGVVTTQFGLRTVEPLSGTAISVPTFTLIFVLLSPLLLWGQPIVWCAVPLFAAVGLFFPAMLTILTFASNRALGPVVTSALGNLAPLFSVIAAVLILHEPLRPAETAGLVVPPPVLSIVVGRASEGPDERCRRVMRAMAGELRCVAPGAGCIIGRRPSRRRQRPKR